MQISTSLFLNTQVSVDKDKVSPKQTALKTFQNSELPVTTSSTQQNIKEVVANLLGSLVSEAKSKSAILDLVQNSPLFKSLGSFTDDLKKLVEFLKSDKKFEKPLLLLQNFQKNIDVIDGKVLKEQVQNSGIFFESKLANKALGESLTPNLKSLLSEVKEHLSVTNKASVLAKDIAQVLNSLQSSKEMPEGELQSNLRTILDLFRQSVKGHLSFETPPPLKEAYTVATKLENAVKQMALVSSKIENTPNPVEVATNFTVQVKDILVALKQEVQQIQTTLQSDITIAPQELANTVAQLDLLLTKESFLPQISMFEGENSIEDQLQMVANRIKQQIALVDPQSVKQALYQEKSVLLEQKLQASLKPEVFLNSAMMQKLSIDPSNIEVLGDMKGVLTQVHEALSSSSLPNAKDALDVANKLLTQIDYHQLVSYVSSSAHLYIPFAWNGLNGGSMMMKQTKEENFHCQIDLDLEKYGKINMMLLLSHDKYIDITIATQQNDLKDKVQEHLSSLKQALNEVGLIIGGVKIIEYKETKMTKNNYFSDENLNFGINISI